MCFHFHDSTRSKLIPTRRDPMVIPGGMIPEPTESPIILFDVTIRPRMTFYLHGETSGSFIISAFVRLAAYHDSFNLLYSSSSSRTSMANPGIWTHHLIIHPTKPSSLGNSFCESSSPIAESISFLVLPSSVSYMTRITHLLWREYLNQLWLRYPSPWS